MSVNTLIEDLLWPTKEVTRAVAAVAQGDLLKTVRTEVDGRPLKGEFLESANIVNTMIKQLNVFTSEVTRVAREVGTEGKLGGQAQVSEVTGVWKDLTESVNSMASNLTGSSPQHRRSDHRRRRRRFVEEDHRRRSRRNSSAQGSHQHDGGSVALVRFGSHARRARSRHRWQARRPGDRARRGRYLERSDRLGQRDVRQLDRPGAQYRASDHRRGARRLVAQDHGGRAWRNSRAERHHQHDGGPTQRFCLGSDARRARSRYRRQAGRPGCGARRRRNVERLDRQRELHGRQSDRPGSQHRRRRHRDCRRRSVEEDHGQCVRRDPSVEGNHQHNGRSAQRFRRRSHARCPRSGHRRPARRPGERARCCRHVEGLDRTR